MKRAILFKPGFNAISFENIIKKMNISLEPENKNGRGTNFSNFLVKKILNYQNHSWMALGADTSSGTYFTHIGKFTKNIRSDTMKPK